MRYLLWLSIFQILLLPSDSIYGHEMQPVNNQRQSGYWQAGKVVNMKLLGQSPLGEEELRKAIEQAGVGGTILVPDNYRINFYHRVVFEKGQKLKGGSSSFMYAMGTGAELVLSTGNTVSSIHFLSTVKPNKSLLSFQAAASQSDVLIENCVFESLFVAIHVTRPNNDVSHHHITIQNNRFLAVSNTSIYCTSINNSIIRGNDFESMKGYNVVLNSGYDNLISHNAFDGGKTGILFISHASAGTLGFERNTISDNNFKNISEENISFDIRGNDTGSVAAKEFDIVGKIEKIGNSSCMLQLASPNWQKTSKEYKGFQLIFTSGKLRGFPFPLVGGIKQGHLSIKLSQEQASLVRKGDSLVIGIPFYDNTIAHNTVNSISSTVAIYLYGLCYHNRVKNNVVEYAGNQKALFRSISLAGIAVSGVNGLNTAGAVTGKRIAPSEFNSVDSNTVVGCNIEIGTVLWGYPSFPFSQTGNSAKGNRLVRARMVVAPSQKVVLKNNVFQ